MHDELSEQSILRVSGPRNHFSLLPSKRYLFIAGGIGITPVVPMVAAADREGAGWRLVYGGRTRASMALREELLARYGDKVSIYPQDETRLLDLASLIAESDGDTPVYCCGPEPLLAAVAAICAAWPAGALRVERFSRRCSTSRFSRSRSRWSYGGRA